ncbi:MAG: 50S ribosome-binding GTPase [Prosthecobacter sp.]|nr:50S ribosome-binding GTPase [Prosthecobacter sp.]
MSVSDSPLTVMLAGLESAGKTALFRGLTGRMTGDETNVRGSTVVCRRCHLTGCGCELVDTPGIRLASDAETTRMALHEMRAADVVLLVARGTHAMSEVEALLRELDLEQKRVALAITFQDKAPAQIEKLAEVWRGRLGIPVVVVNARELDEAGRGMVLQAIKEASALQDAAMAALANMDAFELARQRTEPEVTLFENRDAGPWLALATVLLMFALPVYAAYVVARWLQPLVDAACIGPLRAVAAGWHPWLNAVLAGDYGVLTLGWYSFLWAFPVVVFIGLSVAVAEESGVKDRVTAAMDPWLRHLGLSGRDLIPVLTGFGCNVVAVLQSRGCSACTRKRCVSLIAFGSACSYQIGASLSVFGAAGKPWLFAPYLMALFAAGAAHTRLWNGALARTAALPLQERAFLQRPLVRAVVWRVRAAAGQFLWQAMPVFLGICLLAALLQEAGVMIWLAEKTAPVLGWFHLPAGVAFALVFSVLRKDGLLLLNHGDGTLLAGLGTGKLLVAVWLASTFSACLVTLWTIRRELGWGTAARLAGRQAVTALAVGWLIALLMT